LVQETEAVQPPSSSASGFAPSQSLWKTPATGSVSSAQTDGRPTRTSARRYADKASASIPTVYGAGEYETGTYPARADGAMK